MGGLFSTNRYRHSVAQLDAALVLGQYQQKKKGALLCKLKQQKEGEHSTNGLAVMIPLRQSLMNFSVGCGRIPNLPDSEAAAVLTQPGVGASFWSVRCANFLADHASTLAAT